MKKLKQSEAAFRALTRKPTPDVKKGKDYKTYESKDVYKWEYMKKYVRAKDANGDIFFEKLKVWKK